jgi:ABC-type sugar transport system ATPase subunit
MDLRTVKAELTEEERFKTIGRPALLVLSEPKRNFDQREKDWIYELINEIDVLAMSSIR